MPDDSEQGIYSIGAVSRMLGVERSTIRNWEERFGLVRPQRSGGGQRLFSRTDVERLGFLSRRVAAGDSPAEAHRLLDQYLAEGRSLLTTDEGRPGEQLLVLLAERDRYAADLFEFFLRTEGYEVASSFAAAEALLRYDERRPRVAIVDLLLSGGAGFQLCRDLKERGLGALLALSTLATQEEALEAGADAFLVKPVDPLRLVSVVKDLLGTSALVRGGREPARG